MAWNGRFGDEDDEGRGLELSLGLPGYSSGSPAQAAAAGSVRPPAAGARGSKARSAAAAPVVGWPPVRAFRRNLASSSSSSKPSSHRGGDADEAEAGRKKGLFVKVNMDGVPIGRKVDLRAHAGYATLSAAVDRLFRGLLLAAQQQPGREQQEGILSGGEYTLVYEDDEGDQMLVGDVPWEMFVATAKRLRVLRSADLSPSSLRAASRKRAAADC